MRTLSMMMIVALGVLAGCGGGDGEVDSGAGADAGGGSDGGAGDAGATPDAGETDDAGATPDAGETDDASVADDASVPDDAGAMTDASVADDAGAVADAGSDAGVVSDSGTDTGTTDAGSDAGAMTTCSITVTPSTGTESDTFDFMSASNGTMCEVRLDGGAATLTVPCNGMMSVTGATFGVGPHTLDLLVGAGPSGPTSCRVSFTVTPTTSTTTCTIEVLPETGTESDTFTAMWSSDGTGCTASVDGISLGSFPCVSSFSGMGSLLGPGTHVGTLDVAAGPGGPTSCSDTFTVTP